ncbi:MAG: hypothetical protein ACI9XR_001228 [Flavobacterium sp.]|jgi:hypothetical protein
MKKTAILVTIAFILLACNGQKNASTSSEKNSSEEFQLVYTANVRGFFQEIKIEDHNVYINNDRNGINNQNPVKIADKDWQYITDLVLKVNLDGLAELKAPTEKRFYDGAAIAHLSITKNDKTYQSSDFDNGIPPKEIEGLVKKITLYAVKK